MLRRLFVCMTVLGCLQLMFGPRVWAQSRPIQLGKSLIRAANPGALGVTAMPGMAMPSSPFPNTYNSTADASFDPNTGSKGTLYLNYHFTGTTQPNPMCNANTEHVPQVWVRLYNNNQPKTAHYTAGQGVAPCVQMNQTLTVAFDLGTDLCSLDLMVNGTCALVEQEDQVFCFIAQGFAFFIKAWQFESATTASQVVTPTPPYFLAPYCGDKSDPPDWFGPFGSDTFGTGLWVSTNSMIRWQFIGKSFYGVPWKAIFPIGPAGEYPAGSPKPVCTEHDKGCYWGASFCTGQLLPLPGLGRPDAVIERRDA